MNLEILILFIFLSILAWLGFILINKNITHVTNSHIRILGKENKKLVKTRTLLLARILYFSVLLMTTAASIYSIINY